MEESEVSIEAIRTSIRESLDRAKALVKESKRFVRERVILPPELKDGPDQASA